MSKKAQRAERLVRALAKLHHLEELKKIELQRQLSELRHSEEAIIDTLNSDGVLQGMLMDTTVRFLRSLAREAERVSEAQRHQSNKLLDRAGKLRRAEKLRDRLSKGHQKAESEKHLSDVIERYAGQSRASLP